MRLQALGRSRAWSFAATLALLTSMLTFGDLSRQTPAEAALPTGSTSVDFATGSLILDMGVTPQTIGNGLKPYGFVYELLTTYKVPVAWMIKDGKTTMGAQDFTASVVDTGTGTAYPSKAFAGGSFIIPAEFVAEIPVARLAYWRLQGVKIYQTTAPLTNAPAYSLLKSWPRIVLDSASGAVADGYYGNAGIPTTAYRSALPSALTACDDLFVFPHADPTWALHNQLLTFNEAGGYIFAECHAPSVLENIDDPADPDTLPNMNFLSLLGEVKTDSDTLQVTTAAPTGPIQVVKYASALNDTDTTKNGFGDVGDTITYTYLAINTTAANITALNLTDSKKTDGAVATNQTVNANSTKTWTWTYTVTAADAAVGSVTNTAEIKNATVSDTDTVTVTTTPATADQQIQVVKYVSTLADTDTTKNGFGDAGDTITYGFKVTNTGPLALSEVALTDPGLGGAITCPSTALAVGGQITCTLKTYTVTGSEGPSVSNTATVSGRTPSGLVPTGDHADGTPPYSYSNWSDPILQIMSPIDGATQNGSEQIYLPGTGWRPGAKVIVWDPDQVNLIGGSGTDVSKGPAAVAVYGRGFDDPTNGLVMYQGGHDFQKSGTAAEQVAAQRTFLNFNLLAGIDRSPVVNGTVTPSQVTSGQTATVSASTSGGAGPYTYKWSSSCGGTFADDTAQSTTFTSPSGLVDPVTCVLRVTVTDSCGRISFDADTLLVKPEPFLNVAKTAGVVTGPDTNGNYQATYTITVENTHGATGTYGPITDTPAFASNLTPTGISWTGPGGTSGSSTGSGPYTVGSAGTSIAGHVIHTYAVTVTFHYTNQTQAVGCTGPGTGLYNTATLPAGQENGSTSDNSACDPPPPPPPAPNLNLVKTAGTTSGPDVNGNYTVDYTISIVNTGGPGIFGPITDTPQFDTSALQADGVTWTGPNGTSGSATGPGPYTIGSSGTLIGGGQTLTYHLTVSFHYKNSSNVGSCTGPGKGLYNTGSLPAGQETGSTADNSACVLPPPPPDARLTLLKTAGAIVDTDSPPNGPGDVGDTITYTFQVTNTGSVTLAPVTITDAKLGLSGAPCVASLAPGATATCPTHTYTITADDVAAGRVDNTATASGTVKGLVTTSNPSSTSTLLPALAVDKIAGPIVDTDDPPNGAGDAGDTITYTFQVTNTGSVTLAPVTITDPKLGLVGAACVASLAPGATATCSTTPTYIITEADVTAGSVTNTVTASGQPPTGDPVLAHDTAISPMPRLTLEKVASGVIDTDSPANGAGDVGDLITYTFTVTNGGNLTLAPVTITDPTLDLSGAPCVASLAPGATATCSTTGSYYLTQDDVDARHVSNTAMATGTQPGGGSVLAKDTVDTPIPSLSLIKKVVSVTDMDTPKNGAGDAGDIITYAFTVHNTGTVPLTPVTITDATLGLTDAACVASLAPGETAECSTRANYVLTQADVDNGFVLNVATAKGTPPTGDAVWATDILDTPMPSMTVAKSSTGFRDTEPAGGDGVIGAGDTVEYTITATNRGATPLTDVTVTDPLLPGDTLSCTWPDPDAVGHLAPGEAVVCTGTYPLTPTDVLNGHVANTATATGQPPLGDPLIVTDDLDLKIPAIHLEKSVMSRSDSNHNGIDDVGDTVTYEFTVTNTGTAVLAEIRVVDPTLGYDHVCGDDVAPGATVTCTATYELTQADIDAGSVDNTARAIGQPATGDPVYDDDSATVPMDQNPSLGIQKSVLELGFSTVGTVLHYSYTVTNTGNVTLTAPFTVTDDRAIDENCRAPPATLAPGESITCTATYTTTQTDVDSGSVTNIASAHASFGTTQIDSDPDTQTVTADQNSVLTLDKTADPTSYDAVGDVITYTYTLTNDGNTTLSGPFSVDDDKLSVDCTAAAASLAPGESTTCTASYTIQQSDIDAGSITNAATGHGFFGTTPVDSMQDTQTVTADQNSVLTLDKTADPTSYDAVGDVITYTYTLTNDGNTTLSGPFSVDDDKLSVDCTAAAASLAPGESTTCTASYTIQQSDIDAGSITNAATGHGFFGTTPVDSMQDTQTVTADQNHELSLEKSITSGDPYDSVGDVITYSYTVTNTGNANLDGPVTIDDDKTTDESCPDLTTVGDHDSQLDPGESITCTASYTITQTDLDAGSVTNHATASADGTTSNEDTQTAHKAPHPELTLVKTITSGDTYNTIGDVITYSYLVTNTGDVSLDGPVTIDDDKATDETCPDVNTVGDLDGQLDPGESITCTASYTITLDDLKAGSVTNIATASADGTTSNADTQTADKTHNPRLTIVKTITSGDPFDSVGDVITYSYLVTNTGNTTLTGLTVIDDKTTVTCPVTTLEPGESTVCTSTYVVTQEDLDAGYVLNHVSATTDQYGPGNDQATAHGNPRRTITIDKTVAQTSFSAVGDVLTYTYTVTNTGNATVTGIVVTDDKTTVTCPATSLAPGESMVCTATYVVTQADLDRGSVTNIGTVQGDHAGPGTDTVTIGKTPPPVVSPPQGGGKPPVHHPPVLPDTGGPNSRYVSLGGLLLLLGLWLALIGRRESQTSRVGNRQNGDGATAKRRRGASARTRKDSR